MGYWNWESFLAEFTLPVLGASTILWGFGMLARWAWKRHRQVLFWSVAWLMTFTAISLVFLALQPQRPSARPYFTRVQSKIYPVSTTGGKKHPLTILTVSVQNNDVPAKNITSQLTILDKRLDPKNPPLRAQRFTSANDIGRFQNYAQHTPVNVRRNTKAAFVVFQIKYEDVPGQTYSQVWFMKFGGSTRVGNFFPDLFDVDQREKDKIDAYIKHISNPMLKAES